MSDHERESVNVVDHELVEYNMELPLARTALRKFSKSIEFRVLACLCGRHRAYLAKSSYDALYERMKEGSDLVEACSFDKEDIK